MAIYDKISIIDKKISLTDGFECDLIMILECDLLFWATLY